MKLQHQWQPLTLLFTACLIFFFPVIFRNQVLFFGDNLSLKIPTLIYGINRLKSGHLPLWNPHSLTGIPYFADISNNLFYPLTSLFFFLDPLRALSLATVISFFLTAVFTYYLARQLQLNQPASLAAAISFTFCNTLLHYTSYFNLLSSSIWLPLTFLAFLKSFSHRHWLPIAATALAMQILGGHPQPVYYTILLLFSFSLFFPTLKPLRSRLKHSCFIILTSIGLTAFILLPSLQLARLSTRSSINYATATADSLHPVLLLRLFLPNFFDQPQLGITWGPAWRHVSDNKGYLGIVSVLLILIALPLKFNHSRHRRLFTFFSLALITSLLLALGKYSPIFHLARRILPGFNHFRGPTEALLITNFSTALLAGLSLEKIIATKHPFNQRFIRLILISFSLSLLLFCLSHSQFNLIWRPISTFHTFDRDHIIAIIISSNLVITSALLLLTLILLRRRAYLLIPAVIFADLFIFNSQQLYTTPRTNLSLTSQTASQLQSLLSPQDRFLSYQDVDSFTGLGNYWENMVLQPPFADSLYTPSEQQSLTTLNHRLSDLALNWHLPYHLSTPNGYSSFILTNYQRFLQGDLSAQNSPHLNQLSSEKLNQLAVSYTLTPTSIQPNPDSLPRAYLIDQSGQYLKPATFIINQPEQIVLETYHLQPVTLVLADAHYPGWTATIDSHPITITPHQGFFRSVSLPPGKHQIEFTYHEILLFPGSVISVLSLLIICLIIFRPRLYEKLFV